ncbi:uncharacterized protein LOC110846528 [Folsomia candida]|uniref:uncharacterized protein LOC110846528 n=1 Tax=Folsomia candida TaxID=158441 RepID=UPI000B8F47E0|nr:uncharacterized protein LOC110846528 [Folsomia candida]
MTALTPPPTPASPITIAIAGCGNRGYGYATFAKHFPQWLKVVAVADHHDFRCQQLAKEHDIPPKNIFKDWTEMASVPKLSDAVAICTTDREHTDPAIAFANLKYNILLEKPMSINIEECVKIHQAVVANNVILAVCHVLRYTNYTKAIRRILDSNVLGDIVNIQHLEPVGFWHFAHSFVRGNWHNEEASTFSLLSKSCHDIDLVTYMMGSKCKKVSSFGSLSHFTKKNKPKEAGNSVNCLDCSYEKSCPYSAKKIYIDNYVNKSWTGWPINVVQPKDPIDLENLTDALRKKDYGRCVYEMDNDVVDHQVVNMHFENGSTSSFTMVAFTESMCDRKTRIFGTLGELEGDGADTIKVFDFLTQTTKVVHPSTDSDNLPMSGHGGGDFSLMQAFVYACVTGNQNYVISGPQETLDTHIYCFAAEHARKTGTVVDIDEFKKSLYK